MILLKSHRHVFFINVLVFNINFSSLSGKSTPLDINEVLDGFKINTEEIILRRKRVEPYLLKIEEKQRDWLETNHMSFSADAIPSMLKSVSESHVLEKFRVHREIPSTESIERTPVQKHSKEDKIKTQPLNVDNNRRESIDTEERVRRLVIVEDFVPELKALEKGIEIDQVSPKKLKYDRNEKLGTSHEVKIVTDFDHSAQHKHTETAYLKTEMNGHRTLHNNIEKPQSIQSSDEAVSEAHFYHQTGIFNMLSIVEGISGPVNVVEGTDISFNLEGSDHPSRISEMDLNQVKHDYCVIGDMKESFLRIIKKQTELKDNDLTRHKVPLLKIRNSETNVLIVKSTTENNIQDKFKKNAGATVKLYSVSEKHPERQKLMKSFLSSLNEGKENWLETNNFNYRKPGNGVIHRIYFTPNDREVVKNIPYFFEQGQIQERLFFQRWLKKLLKKLVDYPFTEHIFISFCVTTDSLNDLKMLSESWNVKNAEELFSDLTSNANVHYSYNVSNLYHSYAPLALFIIFSIMVCVLLYFLLLYYPIAKILFTVLACIVWHGFKMYQEKVAEKHATMSGSSPAYCESILNKESGILAHIKEFIRHTAYKDHCEKYYEALMINPIAELSVPIVISDFVSSTFFQVFRPMGRMLNTLVKDLFKDLSFVQAFYLIILLILIFVIFFMYTLVYNRYKLNLPFFMGSAEPSLAPGGSRVEDVAVQLSSIETSPLKLTVSKNNDLSILRRKKHRSPKFLQNDCDYKRYKPLAKRFSI